MSTEREILSKSSLAFLRTIASNDHPTNDQAMKLRRLGALALNSKFSSFLLPRAPISFSLPSPLSLSRKCLDHSTAPGTDHNASPRIDKGKKRASEEPNLFELSSRQPQEADSHHLSIQPIDAEARPSKEDEEMQTAIANSLLDFDDTMQMAIANSLLDFEDTETSKGIGCSGHFTRTEMDLRSESSDEDAGSCQNDANLKEIDQDWIGQKCLQISSSNDQYQSSSLNSVQHNPQRPSLHQYNSSCQQAPPSKKNTPPLETSSDPDVMILDDGTDMRSFSAQGSTSGVKRKTDISEHFGARKKPNLGIQLEKENQQTKMHEADEENEDDEIEIISFTLPKSTAEVATPHRSGFQSTRVDGVRYDNIGYQRGEIMDRHFVRKIVALVKATHPLPDEMIVKDLRNVATLTVAKELYSDATAELLASAIKARYR